jgi:hypothetical protein
VSLATADQRVKLADAKLALAELKELIADLKDENRQLRESINVKASVKYDDQGKVWIGGQPFCGACFGASDKHIRLRHHKGDYYTCTSCKAGFGNVNNPRVSAP